MRDNLLQPVIAKSQRRIVDRRMHPDDDAIGREVSRLTVADVLIVRHHQIDRRTRRRQLPAQTKKRSLGFPSCATRD
jgi:hypothetical protein